MCNLIFTIDNLIIFNLILPIATKDKAIKKITQMIGNFEHNTKNIQGAELHLLIDKSVRKVLKT